MTRQSKMLRYWKPVNRISQSKTNPIQHTANNREWLLVEVPEGATDIRLFGNTVEGCKGTGSIYWYRDLPHGSYTVIGLASEVGEDVKRDMVDFNGKMYFDYWNKIYNFFCFNKAFASLLRSHSLQPDTTLIIEKMK